MKLIWFSLILLLVASCESQRTLKQPAKRLVLKKEKISFDSSIFYSLDPAELLTRLFNSTEINGKSVSWKPDSLKEFDFELSYDGKFHTELDTILDFPDYQDVPCKVVIFRTYLYDAENSKNGVFFEGSPVGVALFFKENDHWKLYRFNPMLEKLGYRCGAEVDKRGEIVLTQCGPHWNCLYLRQEVEGKMGQANGHESFYSLDRLQLSGVKNKPLAQIFFNDYLDYETQFEMAVYPRDNGKESTYDGMIDIVTEVDKEIKWLKIKNSYDVIRLKVSTYKEAVKSIESKIYRYDERHCKYMEEVK